MSRDGVSCAVWRVAMPCRRVMPPVGDTSQLRSEVHERAKVSMSHLRAMDGDISPPLKASLFMILDFGF